jgi:hypothetical protein
MSKKTSKAKARKPLAKKAPKPLAKKVQKTLPKIGKTFVLFGLDEQEQPRGAAFSLTDEALLTRMAKGLGLRIGLADEPHQFAVVRKLPKGDVHASGTKAVPKIEPDLYEKLNALVGGETGVISTSLPTTWEHIEPGHLIIAEDTPTDGWWPAVVVKRHEKSLVLKWRDSPGQGEFIRDVSSVGLLKND